MLSYCFKCRKNSESKNLEFLYTKNGKIMLLSRGVAYGNRKSKFFKEQEASELLSVLGIRTPLSKIPLLGDIVLSV